MINSYMVMSSFTDMYLFVFFFSYSHHNVPTVLISVLSHVTIRHSLMEANIMKTNEHKPFLILIAFQLR